jgi:hypothetical protein
MSTGAHGTTGGQHQCALLTLKCRGIADLVSEAVKAEAEGGDSKVRANTETRLPRAFLILAPAGRTRRAEDAWPRGPQACQAGMSSSLFPAAGASYAALAFTQTVMTSVYGVTFMGARDQISNRCAQLMRSRWRAPDGTRLAGSRRGRRLSTRRRTKRWRCTRHAKCWTR